MAKKTESESDETTLKKKVAALIGHKSPKEDKALRSLRKRLKRTQRKRRALALRKKNAVSKKTPASHAK